MILIIAMIDIFLSVLRLPWKSNSHHPSLHSPPTCSRDQDIFFQSPFTSTMPWHPQQFCELIDSGLGGVSGGMNLLQEAMVRASSVLEPRGRKAPPPTFPPTLCSPASASQWPKPSQGPGSLDAAPTGARLPFLLRAGQRTTRTPILWGEVHPQHPRGAACRDGDGVSRWGPHVLADPPPSLNTPAVEMGSLGSSTY